MSEYHSILIIACGILFSILPKQLMNLLGNLEWISWKGVLNDDSDLFKSYFKNKNSNYIKIAGFIAILVGVIEIIFSQ